MKKQLLTLSLIVSAFAANAQVLDSGNFTDYTLGNVTTDVTGAAAGQGGFKAFNGAVADYQIIDEAGDHGYVLQLKGATGTTGNRYLWKDGTADAWEFRDAGNEIFEVEFEINPGTTTSKNGIRVQIFNADGTLTLGGFVLNADTRALKGLAYYTGTGGTGLYTFTLSGTAGVDVILPANTWSRIGFSLNVATGEIVWKGPGFYIGGDGAAAGMVPAEVDFLITAVQTTGGANSVASATKFDNYVIRAVAEESLLAVNNVNVDKGTFTIAPNPINNVVNVSNTQNINVNKITVMDLNGRVVKEASYEKVSNVQMNVSDLSSGVYMMKINSDKGSVVKKVIKN